LIWLALCLFAIANAKVEDVDLDFRASGRQYFSSGSIVLSPSNPANKWFGSNTNKQALEDDVCIHTHLTADRLSVLVRLGSLWKGCISAAVFAKDPDFEVPFVKMAYKNNPVLNQYVRVELVSEANMEAAGIRDATYKKLVGQFYPINALRNVAIRGVPTGYLLLLDVDFETPATLREQLQERLKKVGVGGMKGGKTALVVPAFELDESVDTVPARKKDLVRLFRDKLAWQVHVDRFQEGHSAVNYGRWLKAKEVYEAEYNMNFEPYIVTHKSAPLFNDTFTGRGANKASLMFELHALGASFTVLPDVFLLHFCRSTLSRLSSGKALFHQIEMSRIFYFDFVDLMKEKYGYTPQKFISNQLKQNHQKYFSRFEQGVRNDKDFRRIARRYDPFQILEKMKAAKTAASQQGGGGNEKGSGDEVNVNKAKKATQVVVKEVTANKKEMTNQGLNWMTGRSFPPGTHFRTQMKDKDLIWDGKSWRDSISGEKAVPFPNTS